MTFLLLAAAEPSAAYRAGEVTGALLVPLALLLGILKCAAIARRPTTSPWCVYALLLSLGGWWALSAATALRTIGAAGPIAGAAAILGTGVCLVLELAGATVGIVGLVRYRRHPEYVQGRSQAIAALVLAALFMMLAAGGLVIGIVQAVRGRTAPGRPKVDWAAKGEVHRFANLNFTYEAPPAPYVRWDARSNKAVTIAFLRTLPSVFLMVIAERSAADASMESAELTSIVQANLASASSRAPTFSEGVPHVVNGLAGVRFSADTEVDGRKLYYTYWVYAADGFLYQVIAFGDPQDKARVDEDAEQLRRRFRQMDAGRRAADEPRRPFGEFRSPVYPYSLDLAGTPWTSWPEGTRDSPGAEVGALLGTSGGMLVTPFALPGEAPHRDALTQALLKEWSVEFPSPAVASRGEVDVGELSGHVVAFDKTIDGSTYDYRTRILAGTQWGVEVTVWSLKGEGDIDAAAAQVFRGLRLQPAPVPAPAVPATPRAVTEARLWNRIGLFYHAARDHASSRRYFEAAARLDGQQRDYLLNLLRAWSEAGEIKAALAFLAATTHPQKAHPDVRSWHAWLLKEDGQKPAALAVYEGLFADKAYRNDEDLLEYGKLLAAGGRWPDLERAFDSYVAKDSPLKLRLEQSRLMAEGDRHEEAIRMLEGVQKTMAYSTEVAFALIRHHQGLDRHRKVLEICDDLIRRGFDSAAVHHAKGDAQVGLKWYRAAKASFEAARKRAPKDEDTLEYLRYVSGLLGEGNNSTVKDAIAPVALPPELAAMLERPSAGPDGAGYGAHYAFIIDGFRFEKGRELVRTTRQRVKVTDSSGVERFSTLEIGFHPLSERVYVNELVVRDARGQVVSRGEARDSYVVDDRDTELATHRQILYTPVSSLEAGHTIDFTFTRRQLGTPDSFPYESFVLSAARPARLRAVYYLGDLGLIRYHASPTVANRPITGGMIWSLEDAPVYPWESRQVALSRFAPVVRIAATGDDWATLARSYERELQPKLGVQASVTALAQQLTRGLDGRESKIHAILRHAQAGYVYKPIEFGRRARIPNTAAETVRRKYGDCKDHSVLLRQMLLAVGIPAHLTLVSTYEDVQEDLPSLDQFDHMIVFVPDTSGGGGTFYDATDKSLGVRVHPPLGLSARRVLVLDPASPRFEAVPAYAPDSSTVRVERRARLGVDGRVDVIESVEVTGYYGSSLRSRLKSLEAAKHKDWAQQELAHWLSGSELGSFEAREVGDADKPLVLELKYTLPVGCTPEQQSWRCTPGLTWEREYLEVDPVASRRTPFTIEYPLRLSSRTTLEAPAGWALEPAAGAAARSDDAFAAWSTQVVRSGGAVVVTFEATLKRGEFPAERYAAFRGLLDSALRSIRSAVRADPPRQGVLAAP